MFFSHKPQFEIRSLKGRRKKKTKKVKTLLLSPKSIRALRYAGIALITLALMTMVYYREQAGIWFKASVLEAPQPFSGTVFPISKVPNWSQWNGDFYSVRYSDFSPGQLIDLPPYNLSTMAFPNEQLIWGNAEHDVIRNMKITYSVVYMGNYELDHQENAGSHLAVDIKVPIGTPIHAMANGKVVKTSMGSTGFGHHIVIQHPNVPDPANPGHTTTLYSCYVHMDQVSVSEGQNVLKGQQIGTSGNTGTSTSPHLHFQIDRDTAPWHPYWPFSSAESQAAGLSFFEAVNAGLGKTNALAYTINPMTYAKQYLGAYTVASDSPGGPDNPAGDRDNGDSDQDQEDLDGQNDTTENPQDPPVEVVENPGEDSTIDTSLLNFTISGENTSLVGNGVTLTVVADSQELNKMTTADRVEVEVQGVGKAAQTSYRKSDFSNGIAKVVVTSSQTGTATVLIGKGSHQVDFIESVKPVVKFRIDHDGHYEKNIVETVNVVALDENDQVTPATFVGVVKLSAKEGHATFIPETLGTLDFDNGVAEVRVKVPNENPLVIRAQNGALVGESSRLTHQAGVVFSDVGRSSPHYEAIRYLEENNIINGYPDGTFRPSQTVNRVEALKMLMLAFNIPAGPAGALPFSDTDDGAWYSSTLATAVNKKIVQGYDNGTFQPGRTVNKAEYLKMLFKTNSMEVTEALTANPYGDVPKNAWYAPYAYLLNRKNLLDVENNLLQPADGMTRGDVAETIYRLKHVLDNNLVTYSK